MLARYLRRMSFGSGMRCWLGLIVLMGCGAVWPADSAWANALECPNEQLRAEQPYGLQLPDCRAYEMVSPLDKAGDGVAFTDSRASVSEEAPAITYFSVGSFSGSGPEPRGAALASRYLSRRGPSGWSTANISPRYDTFIPQTTTPFQELLFTPELSRGILEIRFTPLVVGDPPGYVNLYLADTEGGSYQRVSDVTPPEVKPYEASVVAGPQRPQAAGTSTDLSHVVFQQEASLTEGVLPNLEHVYEWDAGALRQVDVPPQGAKLEGEDSVGAPGNGLVLDGHGNSWHAVSGDGSRVFFTGGEKQNETEGEPEKGQLYVRENPMQPPYGESRCGVPGDACTVEVSASQRRNEEGHLEPDPHGPKPAFYRDASENGSMVFFMSKAELTSDANTGPADSAANLYAYDVETEVLRDLTPDTNHEDVNGAAVVGLVTASADGSYVYFVANGVLSEAANAEGAKAAPGNCKETEEEELEGEPTCNLYVERYNGSAWEPPRFIATLVGGDRSTGAGEHDEQDWVGFAGEKEEALLQDVGPGSHRVRVTPDGTHLAFESQRNLTDYDNTQAQAGECPESEVGRCREVYLYDAVSGTLACASCDPGGARPVGPAELGAQEGDKEAEAFNEVSSFYRQRNLSDDGSRVFFQSPDALVPQDSNGRLDVYEWEQDGVGSCRSVGGCVFPISNAAGSSESHFMDASPSGDDVFVATADQLVLSDTDSFVDVYDVRVEGGLAAPVIPSECTNGDSCKPPASPQPVVFGAPASATFSGAGNLASPAPPAPTTPPKKVGTKKTAKCGRGSVKKHGKCVRKRAFKSGERARRGRK